MELKNILPKHLVEAGFWWHEEEDFLHLYRGGRRLATFNPSQQTPRTLLNWAQRYFDLLTKRPDLA